jgi:hypothetical protein
MEERHAGDDRQPQTDLGDFTWHAMAP